MPSVTIQTAGGTFTVENDSVQNVADLLREVAETFNIDVNTPVAVNGAAATPATPIADGDEVSLTKATGAKGSIVLVIKFAS